MRGRLHKCHHDSCATYCCAHQRQSLWEWADFSTHQEMLLRFSDRATGNLSVDACALTGSDEGSKYYILRSLLPDLVSLFLAEPPVVDRGPDVQTQPTVRCTVMQALDVGCRCGRKSLAET